MGEALPVEGAGQDEVVVHGEFVEAFVEVALVDEAAGFVDDDQGVDDPGGISWGPGERFWGGEGRGVRNAHMVGGRRL